MSITPTQRQIEALVSAGGEPVVMLNLLRFKGQADGIDAGMTGLEAYERYGQATAPFLEAVGGRVLQAAEARQMVIGPEALEWDMVLMVEYPSRVRFLEMATNPEYLKIHEHREAALADSRLIACGSIPPGAPAAG